MAIFSFLLFFPHFSLFALD